MGVFYLFGVVRNDNELWVIDVSGSKLIKCIFIIFDVVGDQSCEQYIMDNLLMEGLVIIENILWIINDFWEKNYFKNVMCEVYKKCYEDLVFLLFLLEINSVWFE